MKAIANILKSYLNPRRFVFWSLALFAAGIPVCFAILTAAARKSESMSVELFFGSISFPLLFYCFSIIAVGAHLRQTLLEGEEADILPRYHTRQLTAAGIIVTPCLLIFLALTFFHGWTPLPALAGFLGATAMTLWFGMYFVGGFNILQMSLLIFPAVLFPGERVSGVLIESFPTFRAVVGAHSSALSGVLILLSLGGIVLFCVCYLKTSCAAALNNRFFISGFGTMQLVTYRQPEAAFAIRCKKSKMAKIARNTLPGKAFSRRGRPHSVFQQTRLIKYVMSRYIRHHVHDWFFQANSGLARTVYAFFGMLIIIAAYYLPGSKTDFHITNMLFIGCGITAATLAQAFQSNKNQLPALYLQTDLPSRAAFMKITAIGYLWTVFEPFLIFMGAAFTAHVFFPGVAWPRLFQLALIAAGMVLVQASIPLFTGERRKTPPGNGWMISIYLLSFLFIIISFFVASWIVVGIIILVCALFFCFALRRWTKSEMDCA